MGSQSWGADFGDEGGGSASSFWTVIGILSLCWWLAVGESSPFFGREKLQAFFFWVAPFVLLASAMALVKQDWGSLLGTVLVGAFFLKKATRATLPDKAPQENVAKCKSCGAALGSMERGLCADCRSATPTSPTVDEGVSPRVAEHISKSNSANVERADRIGPSEGKTTPISASLTAHSSLLATVKGLEGTVIITMQQYEGGPWWSRAFRAKDAATAYLKLGLPLPPCSDGAAPLAEAVMHYSEIADCLVDAQISPLAEAVADSRNDSIDQVTAELDSGPRESHLRSDAKCTNS